MQNDANNTRIQMVSPVDVAEMLSISRSMVWHMVRTGLLPEPIQLSPRIKRWDIKTIEALCTGSNIAGDNDE